MDVRSTVGGNVRRIRLMRKMTQERLAELSDYPQQSISELENGKMSPTVTTLAKLAQALGVTVADLVAGA